MSSNEKRRRRIASFVTKEAWRIRKSSCDITMQEAFWIAWGRVKCRLKVLKSRITGVSYGFGQDVLRDIKDLQREQIKLAFYPEPQNPYDRNAMAVIAIINGNRTAKIGYVPRHTAYQINESIDRGKRVLAWFDGVVGQHIPNGMLGCRFNYVVV